MPAEFFIVGKSLTTFEGVVRAIVPDFDAVEFFAPMARELVGRRAGIRQIFDEFKRNASEIQGMIRKTPLEIREAISLLKRGEIEIRVSQVGLVRAQSRLGLAVVAASLILASAILLSWGPKWGDYPVVGIAVAVLGGILGSFLLLLMFWDRDT